MIGVISRRFLHTSRMNFSAIKSSSLGKLRKTTGYSVSNCKKALELFPDDVTKAEEWLHEEAKQKGWAKWAKIQTRSAMQGLVGVYSKGTVGVMVEVNCETDFVAKNAEFQRLVENILEGCMNHVSSCSSNEDVSKTFLDEVQLNEMKFNSSTVNELVISAVSKFNEKTVAKRAVCFKVKNHLNLSSVSHPKVQCPTLDGAFLGKYGTLLAYKKSNDKHDDNAQELSTNVCQHIIGMNPSTLGELKSEDILQFMREANEENDLMKYPPLAVDESTEKPIAAEEQENLPEGEKDDEPQDIEGINEKDTDESRLLYQPFLLDSSKSVGEVLFKAGVEVLNYERFECGESPVEEINSKQSSSASM